MDQRKDSERDGDKQRSKTRISIGAAITKWQQVKAKIFKKSKVTGRKIILICHRDPGIMFK